MIIARFKLTSPLSHSAFGADAGNAVPLRRMPLVSVEGRPEVPVVSGNAVRGQLRRQLMRELLRACGIDQDTPDHDRIYAALANGGTITKAEKRLDPSRIREVREAIPALSVLGSAMYTWLLPGHCSVGMAWPVCTQTVAAGVVARPDGELVDMGDLEHEYTATRLPDGEEHSPDSTGVGPMPVAIETIAAGAVLESRIEFARHAPEVERSAIVHGLTLIQHLGGKHASGLGGFALEIVSEIEADPYRLWLEDPARTTAAAEMIQRMPEDW